MKKRLIRAWPWLGLLFVNIFAGIYNTYLLYGEASVSYLLASCAALAVWLAFTILSRNSAKSLTAIQIFWSCVIVAFILLHIDSSSINTPVLKAFLSNLNSLGVLMLFLCYLPFWGFTYFMPDDTLLVIVFLLGIMFVLYCIIVKKLLQKQDKLPHRAS